MTRVDSFMLASSCRKLSGIKLIYKVNEQFLKMLDEKSQAFYTKTYNYDLHSIIFFEGELE